MRAAVFQGPGDIRVEEVPKPELTAPTDALGLCGVFAARRLGARRIVAVGHHEDRLDLAEGTSVPDEISALLNEHYCYGANEVYETDPGAATVPTAGPSSEGQ